MKSIKAHHKFVGCESVWACAQIHEKKTFKKYINVRWKRNAIQNAKKGSEFSTVIKDEQRRTHDSEEKNIRQPS